MKLTKITARNFKGLSFSLDLRDVNILIGGNYAGKTARSDAIRFLLLGYLPELGKTNAASFGLSSGREMVVEGEFDNGMVVRRRLYAEGNSIKSEETIPPELAERSAELAVMLNAETYFGLSPRERVNYVFANCPIPEDYSITSIRSQLDAAAGKKLPFAPMPDSTPQTWVEKALEWLTSEAKSAKDYAARMEKTVQGVTTLRAQENAGPSKSLPELDDARAKIVAEIEQLHANHAKLQASTAAVLAATNRRHQLEQQVATGGRYRESLAANEALLATKLDLAQKINAPTQAEFEAFKSEERRLWAQANEASRNVGTINGNITRLEHERDTMDAKTACPYCGAAGDGWKALKLAEITTAIAGLKATLASHNATYTDLDCQHTAAQETCLRAEQAMTTKGKLAQEIHLLRAGIETNQAHVAQIEAAAQELANLPAPDPNATTALEMAKTSLTVATARLREIDEARKTAMARDQDKKRMAEAEEARDKAKEDLAAITAAGKKLREIQGKMVEAAFTPLLATANLFFGAVLKTPIAYNDGEIGTWRDGVWVTHRTMSGTEKLLTYAAIQAALAAKSTVRIMILDELGRISDANIKTLMIHLSAALTTGHIDQVVGIETGRESSYAIVLCNLPSAQILKIA